MKNFEMTGNQELLPLNRPYVSLFDTVLESELSDNPNAFNNVVWSAQALATLTLQKEDGKVVDDLIKLAHRVAQLIAQYGEIKIAAMQTRDEDDIFTIRENSRTITANTARIVNRHILKILWYSFKNGPLKACTVSNTDSLAFDMHKEYDTALELVGDELLAYGMLEVAQALINNTDLALPETTVQNNKQKHSFGSVRQPGEKRFGASRF